MEFSAAIRSGFRNYVVFSGRVSRSELWFWFLFYFLLLIAAGFIDSFLGLSIITGIASLILILPSVAVQVRRLHMAGIVRVGGGSFI